MTSLILERLAPLKIASLNCMNLSNTYEDIVNDETLMESSIITLSETWLSDGMELNLTGYISHFNSVGPGKGIAVYIKDKKFKVTIDIKEEKMQITKLESNDLHLITVYRSEQGSY